MFSFDIRVQEVGCDFGIDSNAVEDRCGVCLGDGTSCETVHKSFDEGEGSGESNTEGTGTAGNTSNCPCVKKKISVNFKTSVTINR